MSFLFTRSGLTRTIPFAKITFLNSSHRVVLNSTNTSTDNEKVPASSTNKKEEKHRDAEKEPLPEWPDGVNPNTGEKGGPKGPEPTRYGDWERKGRVSDF